MTAVRSRPSSSSSTWKRPRKATDPPTVTVDREAPDFDIARLVDAMSTEFALCRTRGHPWKDQAKPKLSERVYVEILLCSRCKSRRLWQIDSETGQVLKRDYDHAPGYLIKGVGHFAQQELGLVRLATMHRRANGGTGQ